MTDATPLASEQITQDVDAQASAYAAEYVMTTEGLDYEPTGWERELIADALHGFIAGHRIAALSASPAPSGQGVSGEGLRRALAASLAKRSVPTMDPVWSAAFNAALDMVARDTETAPAPSCAPGEVERLRAAVRRLLPYAETEAAKAPTTDGRVKRMLQARKDRDHARETLAALSPQGLDAKEGEE